MLALLSVKNYALIERLELELSPGFSVITGETGAGKSIMLGALGQLLGKRADLKALRDPERKCIIEGHFLLDAENFAPFFESLDLDFESPCIIRREISPSGKARAFVNDSPVRLDSLALLAERLIDVHSQHQNLLLNDAHFQLDLLDNFAQNQSERENYQKAWRAFRAWQREGEELRAEQQSQGGDRDYLQFLFDELESAQLQAGEQAEIETQLERAENAGQIAESLAEALQKLEGQPEQEGALAALQSARQALASISRFNPIYANMEERLQSSLIELEDLRAEIEAQSSDLEFEPKEKERLDARLSLLLNLQKKHQVESCQALLERQAEIEQQLLAQEALIQKLADWQLNEKKYQEKLDQSAKALSKSRKKPLAALEQAIVRLLHKLNMAQARFAIALESTAELGPKGQDQIQFMFSANPGQNLASISKVASGGELSRVMLALKAIMAQTKSLPTIILDEIDTGVSGETARRLGEIMREMGQHMQVITITHLPQIASLGTRHFKVHKHSSANETTTELSLLQEDQRIQEIARLLSGDSPSAAALENARSLIISTKPV